MDISWLFFQEFGTSTCVKHVELVWQNENYHMGKETCGEKWRDDVVSLQRTPEFKHFENGWCLRRMRILVYQERGRYGQYTSSSVTNKHGFKDRLTKGRLYIYIYAWKYLHEMTEMRINEGYKMIQVISSNQTRSCEFLCSALCQSTLGGAHAHYEVRAVRAVRVPGSTLRWTSKGLQSFLDSKMAGSKGVLYPLVN